MGRAGQRALTLRARFSEEQRDPTARPACVLFHSAAGSEKEAKIKVSVIATVQRLAGRPHGTSSATALPAETIGLLSDIMTRSIARLPGRPVQSPWRIDWHVVSVAFPRPSLLTLGGAPGTRPLPPAALDPRRFHHCLVEIDDSFRRSGKSDQRSVCTGFIHYHTAFLL